MLRNKTTTKQTGRKIERQINRQTDRQAGRQTDRQAGRTSDRDRLFIPVQTSGLAVFENKNLGRKKILS